MLRSLTLGLALSLLAVACGLVQTEPSRVAQLSLADYGEQFTPAPVPPSGVLTSDEVLETLELISYPWDVADRSANAPIFGTVRCVVPERCLDQGDVPVWLVEFPRATRATGGHAWAVVEAATGSLLFDDRNRPPRPQ
jgi:hypothetical protein